jgi:hypothetical protein
LFSISIDKDFGATVHRKTDDWLKSQWHNLLRLILQLLPNKIFMTGFSYHHDYKSLSMNSYLPNNTSSHYAIIMFWLLSKISKRIEVSRCSIQSSIFVKRYWRILRFYCQHVSPWGEG